MDLKNRAIQLNDIDFLSELHDCIVNNIYYKDIDILYIELWENYNLNIKPKYRLRIKIIPDYINTYTYNFYGNGKIRGESKEFEDLLHKKMKFQIVDIMYKFSTFIIKASLLDERLHSNRNYIIIEFYVENKSEIVLEEL